MVQIKKLLVVLVCMAMLTAVLPCIAVNAAYGPNSGTCGDNVSWWFDGDVLHISGTGPMRDFNEPMFSDGTVTPWYPNRVGSVVISPGITRIGDRAFYGCMYITSITIPEGVQSIGDWAFVCERLETISLPSSLKYIEGDLGAKNICITDLEAWLNIELLNTNPILGGTWAQNLYINDVLATDIAIPDGVTKIRDYAFNRCSCLQSVQIPGSVKSIGDCAFRDCSLKSVQIPNGVESIGTYAFQNCYSLNEAIVSDSVQSMGYGVFNDCTGLKSLTLPFIGASPTDTTDTSNLDYLFKPYNYSGSNKPKDLSLVLSDACTMIADHAGARFLKSVTIGKNVKTIGEKAFWDCDNLTSVNIGSGSIGNYAFGSCNNLTSVNIGDGVTSIGDYAFERCNGLTSISIPDSVTSIGKEAFSSCDSLTSISIPDSVTSIGSYAFSHCDSLTSVSMGDGVTSIGAGAFMDCSSLASIVIPDSVEQMGQGVFCDCRNLKSLTVPFVGASPTENSRCEYLFSYPSSNPYIGYPSELSILLSDACTQIPDQAFSSNKLKSITIGKNVKIIGKKAFEYCTSLDSIDILDGVTSIGDRAFYGCENLASINLGKSLTTIGSQAFTGCSSLDGIVLPNGLKSISWDAFKNCTGLTSIAIPDSVNDLGWYAFAGCTGLTSVSIGSGVTYIGKETFYGCSSLTSVSIPSSVAIIEEAAFVNCSGLTDVYYGGLEEDWKKVSIGKDNSSLTKAAIHYTPPCGENLTWSLNNGTLAITGSGEMDNWEYGAAPWDEKWESIENVVIEGGVESIGSNAFAKLENLKSISIPKSVGAVGENAFTNCITLATVYYGGNRAAWNNISISGGNDCLTSAAVYYTYSPLTTYIGYDEAGELAIMFDAGEDKEGMTVEITSELGNTVYSGVVTDEKNIFAITPKNANVTYTAKITLEDGTVLEEKAALYQVLAKDCAENLKEYANVDLSLINREGIASGVKAISEGGAVLAEGKLTAEAARMMDVYKNEKETVIAIKPQLTRIGLGFGYYEGSKIYAGSGALASADSYGIYSRITIDNETGAAVLNNGVVVVTSTFGAEAVPIPANAIVIDDSDGEVTGFDYWK